MEMRYVKRIVGVLFAIILGLIGVILYLDHKLVSERRYFATQNVQRGDVLIGSLNYLKPYDGDTFWLTGSATKIRLMGVDAPESRQTCFIGEKEWACGAKSREFLSDMVMNRPITCTVIALDRDRRAVSECTLGSESVNRAMVRKGWALAYQEYSKTYVPEQDMAERERLGIWQGRFVKPADWRKGKR